MKTRPSSSRKFTTEDGKQQTMATPPAAHVALVPPDEVWRRIRERMNAPTLLEQWYIVSDSLQEFLDHWKFFENGFRQHKIKLKWMYFSPQALSESLSMRLQWNRHGHYPPGLRPSAYNPSESQKRQIQHLKQGCLKALPTAQQREIHLEFYESHTALPFTAFMSVPGLISPGLEAVGKSLRLAYVTDYRRVAFDPIGTPLPGTFCGVIHHGMYESMPSLAGYVGEAPDPSRCLNSYHHAIEDLFLRCLGEGQCTPFNF